MATSLAEVRGAAAHVGRDPEAIRGAVFCWGGTDDDAAASRDEVVAGVSPTYCQDFAPLADRYFLHGPPDRVIARALEYAEAGAETLVFSPVGEGSRRREIVEQFSRCVLPQLQDRHPGPTVEWDGHPTHG